LFWHAPQKKDKGGRKEGRERGREAGRQGGRTHPVVLDVASGGDGVFTKVDDRDHQGGAAEARDLEGGREGGREGGKGAMYEGR
jgi:hypothetical protein